MATVIHSHSSYEAPGLIHRWPPFEIRDIVDAAGAVQLGQLAAEGEFEIPKASLHQSS